MFSQALEKNGVDTISTALDGEVTGTWKSVSTIDPATCTRVYAANVCSILPLLRLTC